MASPFEFITDRIERMLRSAQQTVDGTSRTGDNPTFKGQGRRIGAGYTVRGNLHAVRSKTTSVFAQRRHKDHPLIIDNSPTPFLDVADADEANR